MKSSLLANQKKIVFTSSIVGLLLFFLFVFKEMTAIESNGDMDASGSRIMYWLPLIIPGILGFLYFGTSRSIKSMWVSILYIIYLLAMITTYWVYYSANDALEAGLIFVMLGIPISITISLLLGIMMLRKKSE